MFYTQTDNFGLKYQMFIAIALFFQINTCGFHHLEEREEQMEEMYQHQQFGNQIYLLCLFLLVVSKFKFNWHCFVTKMCQLLFQVSIWQQLTKCVNCICLNWQLKNSNSHVWQQKYVLQTCQQAQQTIVFKCKMHYKHNVLLRTCQLW